MPLKLEKRTALIILFLLFAGGFFLRAYHFHDWLVFNPDQARDAAIVSAAVEGQAPLPLLGPIAGGTAFHLGPASYYFEYIGARLFGNGPDKMAYANLLFSLLALPLMFFFLRKYFSVAMALALMGLMSVAYFFISLSRYASNPNTIPFFTLLFLYALLEMLEKKNKDSLKWPMLFGLALGIGVELHTLLLLIMPTVSAIVLVWTVVKKSVRFRSLFLIALVALFMNIPQLVSEVRTGGGNVSEFFRSSSVQSKGGSKIFSNIGTVLACQIQANAEMISSLENVKGCGDIFHAKQALRKYRDTPGVITHLRLFEAAMVLSVLFSVLGYALLGYFWKKEGDQTKKNFLSLLLLYNVVALLFSIPVAAHMELRYFVVVFFMPFVLLGLILKYVAEKSLPLGKLCFIAATLLLALSNVIIVWRAAIPFRQGLASDSEKSILGEMEPLSVYIVEHAAAKTAAIDGEKMYLRRFFPALSYLVGRADIVLVDVSSGPEANGATPLFYIAPTFSMKRTDGDTIGWRSISEKKQFGKVTIFILK